MRALVERQSLHRVAGRERASRDCFAGRNSFAPLLKERVGEVGLLVNRGAIDGESTVGRSHRRHDDERLMVTGEARALIRVLMSAAEEQR